jgi:hypothetical protein
MQKIKLKSSWNMWNIKFENDPSISINANLVFKHIWKPSMILDNIIEVEDKIVF